MSNNIFPASEYWSPAVQKNVGTGATEAFRFRGLNAQQFAFNRINIGSNDQSNLHKVKASAKLNKRNDVFDNVQLLALQRLFEDRTLKGGLVIENDKNLDIDVTNNHGSDIGIGIDLNGYTSPQYAKKKQQYESRGRSIPEPVFLYGTETVPAGADSKSIAIELPTHDCMLHRIAVSSGGDANLKVSFRVANTNIMPERYISQVNDQFRPKKIITPIQIKSNLVFEALVSNEDNSNSYEVSIICEAYKVQ